MEYLSVLAATGTSTNLGGAVGLTLDVLQSRQGVAVGEGAECSKPWMILMTDGHPNRCSYDGYKDALRKEVTDLQLHLVPVSIGTGAATETLKELSPNLEPIHITGEGEEAFSWKQFFRFLGTSIVSGELGPLADAVNGPRDADLDDADLKKGKDLSGAAVLR